MDPARDFCTLVRLNTLPFGEGEVQLLFFFCFFLNHRFARSTAVIVFISLFGCCDLRVLPSLSAADSQDRAVA